MPKINRVFHNPQLSPVSLKNCALTWEQILIFPSHLEGLKDRETAKVVIKLLDEGVIKIIFNPHDLNLLDKIWTGTDKNLYDYLSKNVEENYIRLEIRGKEKDIIEETTKKDLSDPKIRDIVYRQCTLDFNRGLENASIARRVHRGSELFEATKKSVDVLIKMRFDQIWEHRESHLREINRFIIEMDKLNATVFPTKDQRTYYLYKFRPKEIAEKPLKAIDVIVPLWTNKTVDQLTVDDILEIRKFGKWKDAMKDIRTLSFGIEAEPYTEEYEFEIKNRVNEVINSFVESFDKPKWRKIIDFSKDFSSSALDFYIPGSGVVFSCSDKIVQKYLKNRSKQSIPLFLMGIKGKYY